MANKISTRQRVSQIIELAEPGDNTSLLYDTFIQVVVIVSIITLYLETFGNFYDSYSRLFLIVNSIATVVFVIDYALRVWTAEYIYPRASKRDSVKAYTRSIDGVIDFLATFPPFLTFITGTNFGIFRIFRLGRILKLPRLQKMRKSMGLFQSVLVKRGAELFMTLAIVFTLMLVASLLMFYAEHQAQPEAFANAFDGLWWAAITLTTVGYGDIYPVTVAGRLLGMLIALFGIGLIALPTGILSGGLMEEIEARKAKKEGKKNLCPHCGKEIHA